MRYIILLLIGLGFQVMTALGAQVDTLGVYSTSMAKEVKTVVILPENYNQDQTYPVVYLLHGYGGRYDNWVRRAPIVKSLADDYEMIIVCPDGGTDSWYWDSPQVESYTYETFMIKELIPYVDQHYKTIQDRTGRAISGLSMGGQGALYLSFRHQDIFGAAGSTAGGVDIRPFPLKWKMARHLGKFSTYPERWNTHAVINMVYLLEPGSLELIIDCGTDDFFYNVNEAFHEKLLLRNIPHKYITGPGAHNWNYWKQSIGYQLLFFNQFFNQSAE